MAGEAAATESGGVNPNVEVGDEDSISTGAGSQLSFDDLDRLAEEESRQAKQKAKPSKEAAAENDDVPDPKDRKPDPKDQKEAKPDKEEKPQLQAQGKEGKPPPGIKIHKLKVGDQLMDVAGDATFTIPVNGKKEEVALQDLVNDYNGRTEWNRRFTEVDKREKAFAQEQEKLNTLVKNVYAKAEKDPDAALDFLAEMNGQDPVKMKESMLRQQIEAILPLAQMEPEQRETWIQDQIRGWRDKLHESRSKALEEERQHEQERAKRQQLMDTYGVDDARYSKAEQVARDFLQKTKPDFDGTVSKEEVLYVDRKLMAWDVIEETVPHLVNHADYDSIVEDVVTDLLRHPELTPETLATQLKEVFGGTETDDKALRNLGRKAAKTATASHAEAPTDTRPRQEDSAVFFEDML